MDISTDYSETIKIVEKSDHAKLTEISREDNSVGNETVRELLELGTIFYPRAEQATYDRLRHLNEIGYANYAIPCLHKDSIPRFVLDHMLGAALVLVLIKLDDQLMSLAAVIRAEQPSDRRHPSVRNDL